MTELSEHKASVKDVAGRVDAMLDLLDNGDVIEDLVFPSATWRQLLKVTRELCVLKQLLAEEMSA